MVAIMQATWQPLPALMAAVIGGLNPPMVEVLWLKLYMGLMAGRFRIQRVMFLSIKG